MVNYCPSCGNAVPDTNAQFCSTCGAKLSFGPSVSQPAITQKESQKERTEEKHPFVALLCSFFVPGLGQVYNGETAKGLGIFFGTLIGFFIFIIPGLLVWLYGLYDAYSTSQKMNAGEIPFKPTKTAHLILFIILAVFIVVLVAFVIFVIALASVVTPTTASYTSAIQPSQSSQTQPGFTFSDVKMTSEGDYIKSTYLTGKITNKGSETYGKYVQINAFFYDTSGVRLGDSSTTVSNLKSGETAIFKIPIFDSNINAKTSRWELTAKGYNFG
jgi:TM2 domain-containing membrane protein YozV